ncbi:MAG: ferritin [Christensenellales bacterium]
MKKTVAELINQQINKELFSAYLYLDFSNYLMLKGMTGFAHWFRIQTQEERDHALLFYDYLHHNNEAVHLEAIAKPEVKVSTVMDVLKESLKHEEFITASINDIYAEALKQKDFRTTQFLDWFTKEQGEEEANVHELIAKLEMLGEDRQGLYLMNTELLARVYTAPSLVVG